MCPDLLIEELRVNGRKEILPSYGLVTLAVCAVSGVGGTWHCASGLSALLSFVRNSLI
jgi:hypothetical protein